jgi:hypothetical protein
VLGRASEKFPVAALALARREVTSKPSCVRFSQMVKPSSVAPSSPPTRAHVLPPRRPGAPEEMNRQSVVVSSCGSERERSIGRLAATGRGSLAAATVAVISGGRVLTPLRRQSPFRCLGCLAIPPRGDSLLSLMICDAAAAVVRRGVHTVCARTTAAIVSLRLCRVIPVVMPVSLDQGQRAMLPA